MDPIITSLQNPKVKEAIRLRDRRAREESGLFLIEGYRELKRAVDAKWKIELLFYCPELFLGTNEMALVKTAFQRLECSRQVFEKLSYRDRPDGLLAISVQKQAGLKELVLSSAPFFVIAESIEKPGNLGTILRSSDAAGVDGVIVADPTTDIYNPNVVRASVGTLFTQPVCECSAQAAHTFLKQHKILTVAATPHAKMEFTQADFTQPLAIVVGTEQYGLSQTWMKDADIAVKIPMFGVADSLNVAQATTLLLYEVVRQRRQGCVR